MAVELLLAEDDLDLRQSLTSLLEDRGYIVKAVSNGEKALLAYKTKTPDIILLDVMMPKMNGLEVCRAIRETDSVTPILFLTALDSEADELAGLGLGADDYINKTAGDEILVARLGAALRRLRASDSTGDFDFGPWRVSVSQLALLRKGVVAALLTEREVALLRWFVVHPNEVFSVDFLLTRFWTDEENPVENMLYVAFHRLRSKLGKEGEKIRSVRGSGYTYRHS